MAEQKSLPAMLSASAAAGGADWGVLQLGSHVAHWGLQGQAGYDHEGNALAYSYSVLNQQTHAWTATGYTVSYLKQDGYLEASTAGTSTNTSLLPTADTSLYDAFGRRIAIDSHAQGQTTDGVRAFAYDANGQILERRDGTATNGSTFTPTGTYATQHYAYVDGQQMGEVDEGGGIDVLSGVTGFSDSSQGTRSYVVQQGDTLDGIAQQVYGDASLWYVVADANGLASNSDLVMGQTLKLPQVTTDSNTAETFKPYDPNAIQGSTTPSLPHAPQPPPSAHHCSALAEIVVIAVVVVASIFTAGVAAEVAAGTIGTAAGGGAAGIMAAGGAALTGGAAAGTAAATAIGAGTIAADGLGTLAVSAAIGGAVGDAAGQLVGDAEGVHQGFSFGEMFGAGLGAGITAGLSGAITGGDSIESLAKAKTWADDAKLAAVGAAGAIGNYAGEKLVGQPAHFSWANVAAAALSAEITAKIGLPTSTQLSEGESSGNFLKDLGGGLVNGAIDSETARLLGGHAQNGTQIFEDAFGNALGNAAIAGIEASNAYNDQKQPPQSSQGSPNAPAPAANGASSQASRFQLPNGEWVSSDGKVWSQDGTTTVGNLAATNPGFEQGTFGQGDRQALMDLSSGMNPGSDFDVGSYDSILPPDSETLPGLPASSGFNLATGSYGNAGASPLTMFNMGSATTYDTPMFDPTAAPNIALPYGVDNDAINAALAKSPIVTAELNEAEANGIKVELTMGADYDAKDGVIEIPYTYASSPDAIVETIAHELGHVMWGDVTLPQDQALTISQQQQFASQQLSAQLQGEGVATINNIAVAEQIWPNDPNVIYDHVNGAVIPFVPVDPVANFAAGYNLFAQTPSMGTLQQGANDIGAFYGQYEHPANNLHETYAQYYMPSDLLNAAYTSAQAAQDQHAPDSDMLHQYYQKLLRAYEAKSGTQSNSGGGT